MICSAALLASASPRVSAADGDGKSSKAAQVVTEPIAQAEATAVLGMLRLLDAGKDQWAIEANAAPSQQPTVADLKPYFKPGSPLHRKLAAAKPEATEVTLVEGLAPVKLPTAGGELKVPKDWTARFTKAFLRSFAD